MILAKGILNGALGHVGGSAGWEREPGRWIPGGCMSRRVRTVSSSNREGLSLVIQEIPVADAPVELLLLADPSEDKIRSYLPESKCFVVSTGGAVVGACVVQPRGAGAHELMSIAVSPAHQKSGYGTALLTWVIEFFRGSGARQLEVGTGTFGYQLAFYQRHGFRVTGIDHDFFVRNYPEPIVEDGIQLFDMLRLTLKYQSDVA